MHANLHVHRVREVSVEPNSLDGAEWTTITFIDGGGASLAVTLFADGNYAAVLRSLAEQLSAQTEGVAV